MKKLLITIAAGAALVGLPIAAHGQDRDGYRDGRDSHARSAMAHGYDANARADSRFRRRDDGARFDGGRDRFVRNDFDRGRFDRGFDARRFDRDRGFDRRDGRGLRGGVVLGFGYGGYPYGGGYYDGGYAYGGDYAGDYPYADYGSDYAYSYPDDYGTYQPFNYGYSAGDDAYYAEGAGYDAGETYYPGLADYGDEDGDYDDGQVPPDAGWSQGGPPVDCGRWSWRGDRDAYEWMPAPCARGAYGP